MNQLPRTDADDVAAQPRGRYTARPRPHTEDHLIRNAVPYVVLLEHLRCGAPMALAVIEEPPPCSLATFYRAYHVLGDRMRKLTDGADPETIRDLEERYAAEVRRRLIDRGMALRREHVVRSPRRARGDEVLAARSRLGPDAEQPAPGPVLVSGDRTGSPGAGADETRRPGIGILPPMDNGAHGADGADRPDHPKPEGDGEPDGPGADMYY